MTALSQVANLALDLAKRRYGYLTERTDATDELVRAGLVTTQDIGDGFMIVRATPMPYSLRKARNGRMVWYQDGAPL